MPDDANYAYEDWIEKNLTKKLLNLKYELTERSENLKRLNVGIKIHPNGR